MDYRSDVAKITDEEKRLRHELMARLAEYGVATSWVDMYYDIGDATRTIAHSDEKRNIVKVQLTDLEIARTGPEADILQMWVYLILKARGIDPSTKIKLGYRSRSDHEYRERRRAAQRVIKINPEATAANFSINGVPVGRVDSVEMGPRFAKSHERVCGYTWIKKEGPSDPIAVWDDGELPGETTISYAQFVCRLVVGHKGEHSDGEGNTKPA